MDYIFYGNICHSGWNTRFRRLVQYGARVLLASFIDGHDDDEVALEFRQLRCMTHVTCIQPQNPKP